MLEFNDLSLALRQDKDRQLLAALCRSLKKTLLQLDQSPSNEADACDASLEMTHNTPKLRAAVEATIVIIQRLHARHHGLTTTV